MAYKVILCLSSFGEVAIPLFASPFLFAPEDGDELHRQWLLALLWWRLIVNEPSLAPGHESRPRTVERSEDLLLTGGSIQSKIGMLVVRIAQREDL